MASKELLSLVDDNDSVELTEKLVLLRTRAQDLESVKKLNCWASNIKDVSVVRRLPNLEVCSLSINKLTTLRDFAHCYNLQELYVRTNNIQSLGDIHYLKNLHKLRSLWLSENPCASKDNYRMTVLRALPRLQKLDNVVVTEEELARATIEGDDVPIPEDFSYSSVFTDTTSSSTEDDKDIDKNDAPESCNMWALPRRKRHQKKREDQVKERLSLDDVSVKSSHDGDVVAAGRENFKSDGDVSPRRTFGEDTKSDGDLSSPIMEDVKSDGDVGPRTFRPGIKSDGDASARSQDLSTLCLDANQIFEETVPQVDQSLAAKSDGISETSKEDIVLENGDNYISIGAKLCGDMKDFKCFKDTNHDKETQEVSEMTYEEAEFELPLKRCFGKTHLAVTVPEILPNLDLGDGNLDLVRDEDCPVPVLCVDVVSGLAAPDGTNINNSATECSTAVIENSQSSNTVVENSQQVVSLLDRIQLDDVMDSMDVESSLESGQNGRDGASDQTEVAPEVICHNSVVTPGQSLNEDLESKTQAVKEKAEPVDWDEYNRLRLQVGLKPLSRVPSITRSINSDTSRTRNSNIVSAVLSLVKELDKDSLEIVSTAVKSRLETFS